MLLLPKVAGWVTGRWVRKGPEKTVTSSRKVPSDLVRCFSVILQREDLRSKADLLQITDPWIISWNHRVVWTERDLKDRDTFD